MCLILFRIFFTRLLFSHRSLNRKSTTVYFVFFILWYLSKKCISFMKKISHIWMVKSPGQGWFYLLDLYSLYRVSIKQLGLQMTQNFNKNGHLFLCLSSHISKSTKTGVIFKFCYDLCSNIPKHVGLSRWKTSCKYKTAILWQFVSSVQ